MTSVFGTSDVNDCGERGLLGYDFHPDCANPGSPGFHRLCRMTNDARAQDQIYARCTRRLRYPSQPSFYSQAAVLDQRVSDWAMERTPIFGSEAGAQSASDYLRNGLLVEAVVVPLATPSGDTPGQWLPAKAKGYGVDLAAAATTCGVTELLKDAVERERPDGTNDSSFPSGHASAAFFSATLANRSFRHIDGLEDVRPVLDVANTALAAGVGWARVEAGKHHPADVLVGAALGYFLTAFIHDAFMNLPEDGSVDVAVVPIENGAALGLAFRF
jgi:hypothetical protein